jgi:hypothetical protein
MQLGLERVEERSAIARLVVAELVCETREAVDREQVAAQCTG